MTKPKIANMTGRELQKEISDNLDLIGFNLLLLGGFVLGKLFPGWWFALGVGFALIWKIGRIWMIFRLAKARNREYEEKWKKWGSPDE